LRATIAILLKILGWLLIVAGIGVLLAGVAALAGGAPLGAVAGKVWYEVSPGSLGLAQEVTQRYVLAVLWDPIAITLLNLPLWAATLLTAGVLAIPGILLIRLAPRRKRGIFW